MEKFLQTVDLFKKYAAEYNFDYLMLAAQGYQESKLNQSQRSPGGAVGDHAGAAEACRRCAYQHPQRHAG